LISNEPVTKVLDFRCLGKSIISKKKTSKEIDLLIYTLTENAIFTDQAC
jgi:hypothetical protein